jgi:DNA-binding CsgD family transcriptional regulator/tetratricopeptide (TPR) repeat protein
MAHDSLTAHARLLRRGQWTEAQRTVLEHNTGGVAIYAPARTVPAATVEDAGLARGRALARQGLLLANGGMNRADTADNARRALELTGRKDLDTFWPAVLTLVYADELQAAEDECLAAARGWARSPGGRDLPALMLGRVWSLSGSLGKARALLTDVLDRTTDARVAATATAWLVELLAQLGEIGQADEILRRRRCRGDLSGAPDREQLLLARGSLHLAAGRFQPALDDLTGCGRLLVSQGTLNPSVAPWRSRAALCASALHRDDFAVALAQEELLAAENWGTPWNRASALHAMAVCRRDEHSLRRLRTAVALLDESRAQSERVRICYDLGVLLEFQRGYAEARSVIDTACAVARASGNETWAERVEAVSRRMREPDSALSQREVAVARMARTGRSNREIADQLRVNVRTVEYHLSRVYQKLHLAGRTDLAFAITALRD